jgi:hypothetical protein
MTITIKQIPSLQADSHSSCQEVISLFIEYAKPLPCLQIAATGSHFDIKAKTPGPK